jgi:hypothetical protein
MGPKSREVEVEVATLIVEQEEKKACLIQRNRSTVLNLLLKIE